MSRGKIKPDEQDKVALSKDERRWGMSKEAMERTDPGPSQQGHERIEDRPNLGYRHEASASA